METTGLTTDTEINRGSPLTVCMLASGSRGNAIYISDGTTSVLVDAGLSGIEIERRMVSRGLRPETLHGILVSHEHGDHLKGVGVLARRYRLPVYINQRTLASAPPQLGSIKEIRPFTCGRDFSIEAIDIHPFSISHDAEDPAGFVFGRNGDRIGLATDLGMATAMVREHLKGSRLLILEANHDVKMLETGPYPWPLKQRIMSRIGHLSNEDSRRLLGSLIHDRLEHVILAHLSETNNTPEKALSAVGPALNGSRARLSVALQDQAGPIIRIG
jgi:phosphoribosyl 1,2-cyclic phosphodiesterase